MRLFGFDIIRSKAPSSSSSSAWQVRPIDGQGPLTGGFNSYIPRKVEASFYEFLRETMPIIDAAIWKLVSLDGHIVVKGKNAALVEEIQEWLYNVPVNDVQKGLQAFHQGLSNEAFEQGFGLGEFLVDKKRRDIIGLRVADSKSIKFQRQANGLGIFQKVKGDNLERELNPATLVYFSIQNENQNPYGTPLFRSCEFVSKVLATMNNSLLNVWERFGDPSFEIIYKTSKADGADHEARRVKIQEDFARAMRAKRDGQSADFVRAIDKNSDITVKVIGADGQVLELETPARHILEQIVAKSGLPPWMLGMHWSTTERLAHYESEMLLADVATRQAAKMPHFYNLVRTLLLLRGRTWKQGDWWLEWEQVNLHDQVAQAQARFLNAQADMYYLQNAAAAGISITRDDLSLGKASPELVRRVEKQKTAPSRCGCKESRPVAWPALDAVEDEYETRLKADWQQLGVVVAGRLALAGKGVSGDTSAGISAEQRAQIMADIKAHLAAYDPKSEGSPLVWAYGQAYSLGLLQAAEMVEAARQPGKAAGSKARPVLDVLKNSEILAELTAAGFAMVRDNATKAILNRILPEIEGLLISGVGPNEVADKLRQKFGDANSDWERLARTELSVAAETAKVNEWQEWGVDKVEFVPAPDGCSICMALAGEYEIAKAPIAGKDTHPRCRCALRVVI